MCGLVGIVNKYTNGFTREQQDIFSELLLIDYVRGPDSTGLFLVTNQGEISIRKEASDPIHFMRSDEYEDIMKKAWSRGSALIGHNRKATKGEVNDANAHPFVVDDNIILVHNGTLWGDHKKIADVEVDSHAIAHKIHETGDVQEAIKEIDGAYALIWYDFKNQRLNFLRNNMRPLWMCETSSSYIWASEKEMLDFVVSRSKVTQTKTPFELPVDTLQSFDLIRGGGWTANTTKMEVKKPVYLVDSDCDYEGGYCCSPNFRRYMPQQQQRHPYENTWPDVDDEDNEALDIPYKETPKKDDASPNTTVRVLTSNEWKPGTTTHFEMHMAKDQNKMVTLDEYQKQVVPYYPYGKDVHCMTFDYCYANQKDSSGGYYLYAYLVDDTDVIVKMFFDSKSMTEERIVQIAGGEYIYRCAIDRKLWTPFAPGQTVGMSPGYVVMTTSKVTLVYGGGIGDKDWNRTRRAQTH